MRETTTNLLGAFIVVYLRSRRLIEASVLTKSYEHFRCKPSWDLPSDFVNVSAGSDIFEYGQFHWDGSQKTEVDYNPFRLEISPLIEQHQDLTLDCDSGISWDRAPCNDTARPTCDSYCSYRCRMSCAAPGKAEVLAACLRDNSIKGCAYNVYHTHWLHSRGCRKVFHSILYQYPHLDDDQATSKSSKDNESGNFSSKFESEATNIVGRELNAANVSSMTVYLVDISAANLREINWKRLKKATLSLPLSSDFRPDLLAIDFGNLVRPTTGFDIDQCDIERKHIPYSPLQRHDRYIYTNNFGASYHVATTSKSTTRVDLHISRYLSSRAMHGFPHGPNQFLVWWPGEQPLFSRQSAMESKDPLFLKVQFRGYSTHFLTTEGFKVLHPLTLPNT